jgi:hypothetical protein
MTSWPFDQPKNCAVFTTTHVMNDGHDIIYVFHDADDHGWQFHYGGEKGIEDSMVVCLSEIVSHDATVLEVADLPPGWMAWRTKKGDGWQRAQNPREEMDSKN